MQHGYNPAAVGKLRPIGLPDVLSYREIEGQAYIDEACFIARVAPELANDE